MLLDFSHGIGALLLTCIFRATRETSYYTIDHVQSRIIETNALKINLRPTCPDIPPPPAQSLRSPPSIPNPPFGRGRGRGSSSSRAHQQYPSIASDRSSTVFRIAKNNPLPLQSQLILKYYVIVNGAGGIAGAGIFQMNFNDDGVCAHITNVPFNIHKSFHTEVEAWTYLSSFYPHVRSPDDISFMNENCPKEASNLTNPSPRVREVSGLAFSSHRNINEFFYFDDLPDTIKTKRLAATRMLNLGLHPYDDYTFLPITHTITSPSPPTTTPTTTTTSPLFSSPPPPSPPVATITPTSALPHTRPTPSEADCDMMSLADSSQALLSPHNGDGYHTGLYNQDDDLSSRASS